MIDNASKSWYQSRTIIYTLVITLMAIARPYVGNIASDVNFANLATDSLLQIINAALDCATVFASYKAIQGRMNANAPVHFIKGKE